MNESKAYRLAIRLKELGHYVRWSPLTPRKVLTMASQVTVEQVLEALGGSGWADERTATDWAATDPVAGGVLAPHGPRPLGPRAE